MLALIITFIYTERGEGIIFYLQGLASIIQRTSDNKLKARKALIYKGAASDIYMYINLILN